MRKVNRHISLAIVLLMIVHLVAGSFQMFGIVPGGQTWLRVLSYILLGLVIIHAVIGTILTADTLRIQKKSGAAYPMQNKLFWTRRISGFVMLILIAAHIFIFRVPAGETIRLRFFGNASFVLSILLGISLLVHIVTNIRPLFIGYGSSKLIDILVDVLFVSIVVTLVALAAFVIYYIKWNVSWR